MGKGNLNGIVDIRVASLKTLNIDFPLILFYNVVTCWERAGLLALLYVMFSCVSVTFQYGVLGQVLF